MLEMYVADSESSSIRALDLKTGGSRLLAGGDPVFSDNLFKVSPLVIIIIISEFFISERYIWISSIVTFLGKILLQFGDHDGIGTNVLFQHPLGVFCGKDGQIYIADSYNHKVLVVLD